MRPSLIPVFRLWYGLNSGLWDDQASDLVGQLAIAHIDPARSDPSFLQRIPRSTFNTPEEEAKNPNVRRLERSHRARLLEVEDKVVEDEDGVDFWVDPALLPEEEKLADPNWRGIRKDVGIFTHQEFEFLMSKCLRSLSKSFLPLASSIDLTVRCASRWSYRFIHSHVGHYGRRSNQSQSPRRQETDRPSTESSRGHHLQHGGGCACCSVKFQLCYARDCNSRSTRHLSPAKW